MREIKFRAWDSVLNEYRTIDMNSGKQNLGMGFEATEGIGSNTTTIYHSVGDVIEQYSGLKDKNGVEIYEGDIVKLHIVVLSPDDRVGEIKYSSEYGYSIYFTSNRMARQEDWSNGWGHTIEVIGNIHENADLLDDTDRISPDDIGNDIHEFLHGGDK